MIRTRTQLATQAETVNVIDNNTKEIEAVEIRNQYTDERDSTINILDDGISPKSIAGSKLLTYALPPILANLTDDDIPTKKNVVDLISTSAGDANYKEVTVGTYLLTDSDNGFALHHSLVSSQFFLPFNSGLEIFRVTCNSSNQTTISPNAGVTLKDYGGNVIANWSNIDGSLYSTVVVVNKEDTNIYRITELKEPTDLYETVSFNVSSDAPVSDDVLFFGLIEIDTASQVLHPKLTSVSYEVSLDGITYVAQANLTALQSWITTNGTANDYVIRTIAVYDSGKFGSASSTFKFKTV